MKYDPAAAGRFAGMMGYYHKFIPHLHTLLAPFHELKQKGADAVKIMSSLAFKASFHELKRRLMAVTQLKRPDFTKPFYVDVDSATSGGVGAALSQREDPDDPESHVPLAFRSRRFNDQERGYSVRDQECLGLAESLVDWRQYLLGANVIVRTDHKSLCHLTRAIIAEATRTAPTAEIVADLLLRLVIRYFGCPRILFSDSRFRICTEVSTFKFTAYE
ncbi:hypothetical protein AB1Y20_023135 [Prymnesium parvum]|uniref:Reverse transcriptase RNase H-like domain-containing protein n=1 Tax=Prymnesium parvum TaxID=97485 RepID=A0AB34JFC5_PRYPA